jgi:hypothetical protein
VGGDGLLMGREKSGREFVIVWVGMSVTLPVDASFPPIVFRRLVVWANALGRSSGGGCLSVGKSNA